MKRSTDRILTTHAGSLPRPAAVLALVEGRDQREVVATPGVQATIDAATTEAVRRQVDLGIDIPSD
ncbi:MAG TPA: epoxyalkane--coenzyme M transferase, partial [Chloroflexota bacterium]